MSAGSGRGGWLVAGALAGYLLLMVSNPARPSLRDGWNCLCRYPRVWVLPAISALAHAGFGWWVQVRDAGVVPFGPGHVVPWNGWEPPAWNGLVAASWLPTFESSAAIFNCIVSPFPLSALGAGLFMVNWQGSRAVVGRGLRQRFGRRGGSLLHVAVVLCALAAMAKLFFFGGWLPWEQKFGPLWSARAGEIVNWLSFCFECLLGVTLQIYLVVLCYAWIRGLRFDFTSLRHFALRRLSFGLKWALVILAVSSLGINLPLIWASFDPSQSVLGPVGSVALTRWVLAVGLLPFCAMQILLVFHNESLRSAGVDQGFLWLECGWQLGWFVVLVALHFFGLTLTNALVLASLGTGSWPASVWRLLVFPLLWSGLAGWFLVSWVCLYQRCERRRPEAEELTAY